MKSKSTKSNIVQQKTLLIISIALLLVFSSGCTYVLEKSTDFYQTQVEKYNELKAKKAQKEMLAEQTAKQASQQIQPQPAQPTTQPAAQSLEKEVPLSMRLKRVDSWAYQLNTYKEDKLDEIKNSKFNLVVIDYSRDGSGEGEFTKEEIEDLKASGKIVLAYMSIGEAEDYRYYWNPSWKAGSPSWFDAENPEWKGNYKVKFWDSGWQDIFLGNNGYLDKIMDAGFDGVYMDIIDGYEYYQERGISDADRRMVDFVRKISKQAKSKNPEFLIFPQNGEGLAKYKDYLDAVDGIGAEDTWYNEDVPNEPAEVQSKLNDLLKFKKAGKLVLTVDYVSKQENIDDFYSKSRLMGFVPYATVRGLDKLSLTSGFL
ncbi:MAG TPA: MJ1477/TM1410 family putative glycoside hydrolase [Candidatus Nanoarchaeia archaeon]|nr:MJ1477/TM1410 family putative glycoside hydrolase [Candidatus Nanoarchaeia archaeon]